MNQNERLAAAEAAIVACCDCLGEATAALVDSVDEGGDPKHGTIESAGFSVERALLALWRYRWDHGPNIGRVQPICEQEDEATE